MSGQPSESTPKGTTEILVVGGTYRETCLEPTVDALRGSGLRAAAILASLGRTCSFTTLVDEASAGEAAAMSHDLGFVMTSEPRTAPVTFSYDTPISTAQWNYGGDREKLEVTGSTVVAFGMVDADCNITADRLVIDPQHGDPAEMLRTATVAEAVAVVLNSHEAYRITGLPPRAPERSHFSRSTRM